MKAPKSCSYYCAVSRLFVYISSFAMLLLDRFRVWGFRVFRSLGV